MTSTKPSREELEAKAKELAERVGLWTSPEGRVFAIHKVLTDVARSAREDAVERCAKIADNRADAWTTMDTKAVCHDVAFAIRTFAFKPEEPDVPVR